MSKKDAIDELYRAAVENEEELNLGPEEASKLVQIAVVCSGQHVKKISHQFSLQPSQILKLVKCWAQSAEQSLDNYLNKDDKNKSVEPKKAPLYH